MTNKTIESKKELMKIPSVNSILQSHRLEEQRRTIRHDILKKIVREVLATLRTKTKGKALIETIESEEEIYQLIIEKIEDVTRPSLKRVINATGVVLNTNLGRAPFGLKLLDEIAPIISGYNNLEYDLDRGERGNRNEHLKGLLKLLFDCEDSVVVNNNAAAVFLTLETLTKGKEVIVSRGELVEIGGSFRIPEIIETSGAVMVEVGTTNKTKLSDYQRAINENTAAILKVHKSNYYIGGFTEEVSLKEIVALTNKHNLISIFDFGTGLPYRSLIKNLTEEPDIDSAIKDGADIVTFSCDKLLGGPQAGLIAGKKRYVDAISKNPLMRILRVDKLTISALYITMRNLMLNDELIKENILLFNYLNKDEKELDRLAKALVKLIDDERLTISVEENEARCGGGTLPDYTMKSRAVQLKVKDKYWKEYKSLPENLYYWLLKRELPIVAILKEGNLLFDVITLNNDEIESISAAISEFLIGN